MKGRISKGLIKYGLVIVMLTLALTAYFKPQIDEFLSRDCVKVGVAGLTVTDISYVEFSIYDGMTLNEMIKSFGIKGYETITIKTIERNKVELSYKEANETIIKASDNDPPTILLIEKESEKKVENVYTIQCE